MRRHEIIGLRVFAAIAVGVFTLAVVAESLAQTPTQPRGTIRQQGQEVIGDKKPPLPSLLRRRLVDPRQAMRKLVGNLSRVGRQLKRNFVVIAQDGLELLEQTDAVDTTREVAASNYIRALDGVLVKGLFYRPPPPGKKGLFVPTDKKLRAELVRLADLGKGRGLRVMVTDFVGDNKSAGESLKQNIARGYVPFAVSGRGFAFDRIPRFPSRPVNENPANITGLSHARNFLYLRDSSQYDRQEEFVVALNNTNYDAVIVDVFHRGRRAFTKRSVDAMKFKKLGARRLVLAYMNIGEAETFRYYWKQNWREGSPPWIAAPVAGNPDKFYVQYWHPQWQKLLAGDNKSYLFGIFAQCPSGDFMSRMNRLSGGPS